MSAAVENFQMLKKSEVNFTMFAAVNTVERSIEFASSFPYAYASVVYTIHTLDVTLRASRKVDIAF